MDGAASATDRAADRAVPGRLVRGLVGLFGRDEGREPPEVRHELGFALTRLDKAALFLIGVVLLIFFVNRGDLRPKDDSDHDYHMAVARQIIDQRRIPAHDDWEYAPAGRPHLYPPGLHLAIALFAGRAENLSAGFETLQVLTYPLALFLMWWFARWLFGPGMGLLAALLFSMDMIAGINMVLMLPGSVVTALLPLILMCFLTKRKLATVLLLALALYTHPGVPATLLLGFFIFSARTRGYWPFFKSVLGWTTALYLPWIIHVLPQLGWLGVPVSRMAEEAGAHPGALIGGALFSMLMLQAINPVMLAVQTVGFFRFKHPAAPFLKCMLAAFLPMLLLYGGRFWMHAGPILALFAAAALVKFLPDDATIRRVALLTLATAIPFPVILIGLSDNGGLRVRVRPNIACATLAAGYVVNSPRDDRDFKALADFIERNTKPREIVHVDPSRNYLGDRIVAATGRRVDVGGWATEVRNRAMVERVQNYRRLDTDCLFVYENAEVPASLSCDRVEKIGRYSVGIRGKTQPLDMQTHPDEKTPKE